MDKNPSTILIIDDEPAMREALGELLAEEGYYLSFAQSGEEGLAKAAEIVPDLILLDVVMPDLDGFTVCRKLRADRLLSEVPIIITTSLADRDSRLRGFAAGADDYVIKPVDEPELLARVRTTTRLNRYRRLLEEQTGREMAEEALDISETRYRSLFDNVPVGLYRSTLDGQTLEANPALVEMLGYPDAEALLAANAKDGYADSKERQQWQAMMEQEDIVRGFETQWRRYDGTTIWVRENSRIVRDEKGQVLYYEGAVEDITERKRAEEELRKREAHQALVLGSLPMAFYTAQPYGDYGGTWVSDQINQIVGFTAEQFLGDTHLWAVRLHPEDRERALDAFEKLPDTETLEIEYRWQAADGRYVWLLDHAVLVRDENGKPQEIVGTWLDITERKQAEETLEYSLQKAAHGQALLLALSEAAQAVQRARTPQEVYQTIGEEIAKLGYRATIFGLAEDGKHLTVGYMTFESSLVKAAEKLVGLSAQDYRVRLTPGGFYERLIAEGEPVFSNLGGAPLTEALPKAARPLADKVAELFGLHQAIYVPLKIGDQTQAILTVMGADLTEGDIPAMTAFANQAAIAVANAQLYQAANQERDKAQQYLDIAGVMLVAIDAEGEITLINRKGCEILGCEEDKILGKNWFDSCLPSALKKTVKSVFDQLIAGETEPVEYYENPVATKSGEERLIAWHNTVLRDEAGNIVGTLSSGEDITERAQAEEALRESEENYRSVVDNANVGIVVIQEGKRVFHNAKVPEILGYSEEEYQQIDFTATIYPDDRELAIDRIRKRVRGEAIGSEGAEIRLITKSGETRWVQTSSSAIHWEGKPAVQAFVSDITERVRSEQERAQAEAALKESEEKYRNVVEHAHEAIVVLQDERLKFFNPQTVELTGYSLEELASITLAELIHPDDRTAGIERQQRRLAGEDIPPVEVVRIMDKQGNVKWVENNSIVITWEGKPAMLHFVNDITERVHSEQERAEAEQALQESEIRYRTLYHSANDAIFLMRYDQFIDCNPATETMFGRPYSDLVGGTPYQFSPSHQPDGRDSKEKSLEKIDAALAGALQSFEWVHCRPDGSPFTAEVSLTRMDINGELLLLAIVRDITERKQAEEALRQSEETARALLNATNDLAILIAPDGAILASNEMAARAAGIAVDEMLGASIEDFLSPDLLEIGTAQTDQVQSSGEAIRFQAEREGTTLDISIYPVFDAQGELARFAVFARDVTEQIKTRQAIEQRSRELAALNEIGQAVISTLDLQEMLTLIAEHTNQLMGMAATSVILHEEADDGLYFAAASGEGADVILGKRLAIDQGVAGWVIQHGKPVLIPDVSKDARWYSSLDAQTGFSTRSILCVPLKSKDYTIGALEALNKPGGFTQDDLHLLSTLAAPVATAIENARLFKEVRIGREQLQSLSRRLVEMQEAERAHVARELHDETGQALSGMLLSLSLLEQEADQPEAVSDRANELLVLVDDMLENLHRLAMNLRPATLDHLGLLPALEQYVETFEEQYGIETQFEVVNLGSERLPPEMETALYRIVQESLTNVARHAQATRIDVLVARRDDLVVTIVEDNGGGFDPEMAMQTSRLGLLGMRERAEMLNGRLVIESVPGSGTTVLVEVPYRTA